MRSRTDPGAPASQQDSKEIRPYGRIATLAIALAESVIAASVENLNQLLADTMTLLDMYKKRHWQVGGPTFYQLHLLYDKHYKEQSELVDSLAQRIQMLGGVSIAMAQDGFSPLSACNLFRNPPKYRARKVVRLCSATEDLAGIQITVTF
jgi:starvation-inducible DNA-binding protein